MSELKLTYPGYVCAPYLHNHESVELKEKWMSSKNIQNLYFVTGTFSNDSKPYFADFANHYMVAKFRDSHDVGKDLSKYNQAKTSFVFNINNDLFSREVSGETNFVSVYYLEYGAQQDLEEIAHILLKREKVKAAGLGSMDMVCTTPSKFTFPYSDKIVVIEVTSEKGHQSVKKYCEQTRRDANRKGLIMTNMLSLSILERLK
ncbi:MAG: hypothetical protein OXC46_03860 [Thaumarchaeota archaeon]|nr:hypothetical protein [Nitrososphaerota archaeon]